ncbi:MAG: cation:proton antiporter [Clostridiales bacterium]|nr:cation:proton antiporter [Clostridiales bacterium]
MHTLVIKEYSYVCNNIQISLALFYFSSIINKYTRKGGFCMPDIYQGITSETMIIVMSIAIMLFSGFAMTRLTKLLHLPNVTGYIIAGILIGPYCLKLVHPSVIQGMDFMADIALAFIAFGTGQFFKFSVLKKNGPKVIVITLFEALLSSVLVFIVTFFILRLNIEFSIVISALAMATAPASTLMTIKQTKSKGDFVDTLLQVIAIDDVVALTAFSITISIAFAKSSNGISFSSVMVPVLLNIVCMLLGGLFGWVLKFLISSKRSNDNRLIIAIAVLFSFCGICVALEISPLLGCMAMGMIYVNTAKDDKLFKQLSYFSPPILLLFFVRSGANFNLGTLFQTSSSIGATPLIVIGILYFLVRIAGKYLGSFAGSAIVKKDRKVRNYLGLALIPQASVAIGLATLGARTLGPGMGDALQTIIISVSILYELIGPACGKFALYKTGSYSENIDEVVPVSETDKHQKSQVEILIDQIQEIQKTLPEHPQATSEEEQAFNEAAEEQYENFNYKRKRHFGRK